MGGCPTCMKISLIFINVVVALLGLAAAGLGIYVLVEQKKVIAAADNAGDSIPMLLDKAAIVLIVGGCVVVIIACLGVFGACRESRCLIGAYGVIVALVLVVQIVSIILVCVYKEQVEALLQSTLYKEFTSGYSMPVDTRKSNPFSSTWDDIQYELECCGVKDHTDYKDATYWHDMLNMTFMGDNYPLPSSCCKYNNPWVYPDDKQDLEFQTSNCYSNRTKDNAWLETGCYKELKRQIVKGGTVIISTAAAVGFVEFLALLFAWALFCQCCGSKEMLV